MSAKPDSSAGASEREIFLGCLDKTPAERVCHLDAACGDNRELRQRIDDLLSEQDAMGGFLETPASTGPGGTRALGGVGPNGTQLAAVTERPGDRIGRYKLLQVIGEGGCGVVYMAEQEEPVRRRVALKVIKLGMDTKSVIARFEAERQALAMMDHSNIARVFDAGATATGRPFFVMELVRGVRITDYCDQNHLKNEDRLALFVQACLAIQHAHQKGIIHRDIKPSNILVTLHDGVPVPKVIDFGIAKATEQRLTEKTLFTEFQSFIGTPAYTSPEQAEMSGLDIDTRSDIYSLGVLLYEMLTGRTPFDPEHLMRSGLDEMRRIIREEEPVRPSTRLSSLNMSEATAMSQSRQSKLPLLMQAVRGDLDWIVMKCLEKDRTRRYATANALAEDIQRYLTNEPVLARPPSNVYRLQKMLRRNRGPFAAAAAIAITLITGATLSTWLAIRATKAERAATSSQKLEAGLRRQAEQDKSFARLNEYVADINLAQQSLDDGNFGRAVQLLDKHQAIPGEPDLRGFEWRYLWQRSRGDAHVALPKQEWGVQSIAVSPDGQLVAVGSGIRERSADRSNERITVWNLKTHALVTNIAKGAVSLTFLPDGKRLVSASLTTVRIWNTSTWKEEASLADNGGPVSFSADATRLATSSREGVRIWNTSDWGEARLIASSGGLFAVSPDGNTVATETTAGIKLIPLQAGRPEVLLHDSTNLFSRPGPSTNQPPRGIQRFRENMQARLLAFSPDGRTVVAARNTLSHRGVFVLSVWDAATGQEIGSMPADPEHIEHAGMITSLTFSPDGRRLATTSTDYSVKLWDITKLQPIATWHGHLSEVWTVAFSPDGQSLISGSKDGDLKLWSVQPPRRDDVIAGIRHPQGFSKDGHTVAGLTRDGGALLFLNLQTSEPEQQFELEPKEGRRSRPGRFGGPQLSGQMLSDDLRRFAQSLDDGTIKIWDTRNRESITLEDPDGPMGLVALSPDGQSLVTRGKNWALRWWDLRSGTNTQWRADVSRILFSPDGRTLATTGRENAVQLWDAATLTARAKLDCDEQPTDSFTGMANAFSVDSRMIAIAYQDDSIRLWDVATGQLRGVCAGHKQGIRSVAFAPDGKTLASASDDSTVKLWNVATQQEVLSLRNLGTTLSGLTFSPDGRILLGGSGALGSNGGLRLYRAASFTDTDRPQKLTSAKD